MSIQSNLKVIFSDAPKPDPVDPVDPISPDPINPDPEQPVNPVNPENSETNIDVPDTGHFNHYDMLKTGTSVFGIAFLLLVISLFIISRLKKKNKSYFNYSKKTSKTLKALTIIFFITTLGFSISFLKETTFAETKSFLELPLHASNTLTLDANILGSDNVAYEKATIVIMQDSEYGYRFSLSANDTKLKKTDDESIFATSLTTPGALENNTFGYTLVDPKDNPNDSIWHPIQTTESGAETILDIDRPVQAGEEIELYFGVRSKDLTSGTYNLELSYTAVSKTPFSMQAMNSDVCSIMEEGITYEFTDERDDKKYNVSRLKDGRCWMTSDLATELYYEDKGNGEVLAGILKSADGSREVIEPTVEPQEEPEPQPVPVEPEPQEVEDPEPSKLEPVVTPITKENTDLNSKEEWFPNESTLTEEEINQWKYEHADGEWWWNEGHCYSNEECSQNRSLKARITPEPDSIDHVTEPYDAYYYNWYTATLNSVSFDELEDNLIAPDSICPKGWSLPNMNQFSKLIGKYGMDSETYSSDPLNFKLSGYVYLSGSEIESKGYRAEYFSSQIAYEDNEETGAYLLEIDDGDVNLYDNYLTYGYPLRCVSNVTNSNIIFNANTDSDVTNMPSNQKLYSADGEKDIKITIPENIPEREGYRFVGWSTSQEGGAEYEPSQEITIDSSSLVLYAVWAKETGLTMQEMTEDYCRNNIEEEKLYSFKDVRDGKDYVVTKYKDGNCWMATNLDLDLTAGVALTPETTDVTENYIPSVSTSTEDGKAWEYNIEECMSNPSSCPDYSFDSGNHLDGNFYNIISTTAGTVTLDEDMTTNAESSICPKGWTLGKTANYNLFTSLYDFEPFDIGFITPNKNEVPFFTDSLRGIYDSIGFSGSIGLTQQPIEFIKGISLYYASPLSIVMGNVPEFGGTVVAPAMGLTEGSGMENLMGGSVRCIIDLLKNEPTPKSILGENGNLNFVYDKNEYKVGETYTDNLGETKIDKVCEGYGLFFSPCNNYEYSSNYTDQPIRTVNFDATFKDYKPESTADWFADGFYLSTITNPSNLDMSNVRNASYMFEYAGRKAEILTLDLSSWNVSSLKNVEEMFYYTGGDASEVNINLSGWDLSSLTSTNDMFEEFAYNAGTVNFDLSNWNTSNVTDMSEMFSYAGKNASIFSLDLSNWNTSNVTNMSYMFSHAGYYSPTFSLDLSSFNTSNVTDMSNMFYSAGQYATTWSIEGLSDFSTSKVTNMEEMFNQAGYKATDFSLDLSNWDVSNVTNMVWMFHYTGSNAKNFHLDLSGWNNAKITSMEQMLAYAGSDSETFYLDLSEWKNPQVTSMNGFLQWAGNTATSFTLKLDNFDTSNVTDMGSMFYKVGSSASDFSLNLSSFDTSKVTSMRSMFGSAGPNSVDASLNLSNFDTSNVTDMYSMFSYSGIKTIYVRENWNTSNVSSSSSMFYEASKLVGGAGTTYNWRSPSDKTYARIDRPDLEQPGYFTDIAQKPQESQSQGTSEQSQSPMNRTEVGSNWSAYDSSDNSEETSEETEESEEKTTPSKKKESDDGYVKPQGVTVESGSDNSGLFIILACALSALTLTIILIVYERKKNEDIEE